MVEDKRPEEPKDRKPREDPRDNLKNPLVDMVCPLCRTYGKNVKFMDLRDDNIGISLTIITCLSCRGVYSYDLKVGEDGKSL